MNSGLYAWPGSSATASAAAWARRLRVADDELVEGELRVERVIRLGCGRMPGRPAAPARDGRTPGAVARARVARRRPASRARVPRPRRSAAGAPKRSADPAAHGRRALRRGGSRRRRPTGGAAPARCGRWSPSTASRSSAWTAAQICSRFGVHGAGGACSFRRIGDDRSRGGAARTPRRAEYSSGFAGVLGHVERTLHDQDANRGKKPCGRPVHSVRGHVHEAVRRASPSGTAYTPAPPCDRYRTR